jgi:hypothetical protein
MMGRMAKKITVTIPDGSLPAVEAAAHAAGKSVSAWVAEAADSAAVRDAAQRFRAALGASSELTVEHDAAREHARAAGRRARTRAAARAEVA